MKQHLFLIVLSAILVVVGSMIGGIVQADDNDINTGDEGTNKEKSSKRDPLEVEVTLQKRYMDGEVVEETREETIASMQDFWAYYEDWQLVNQQEGEVVFRKQISDISPYLKENGYFGLDDNILTIFDGKPGEQQAIQSFYQIETSELETFQEKQLQDGIKIESKEVYQTVLEAYRDMAPTESVNG
ncbi:BofC C-terminal domain-containing protein [Aquibacillus sediminis]|uniref:BofC C-terminal domain-containing protein n=1 Tax=Aquibacillus sediminis TaxID=2574734 RepID=UPI001107E8E6|nr:BofC C-terminal domain-containing protein [Aquibacillus sediminis]